MNSRSSSAGWGSVAAVIVALSATAGCHDADSRHVLNPEWNVIPPGPSPVVEETRPVSGVSGVILSGVGQVSVRQGGAESLHIRTEERILPFIKTEMRGGQLVIGFQDGTSYQGEASVIQFELTAADLNRAELDGLGLISASNIDTDHLSLVHTGIGTIDILGLAAHRVDATRSGVGAINVSGSVQRQSVTLGGVGNYDARQLDSAVAEVTIQSGGSATVRVSDRLDVRINGAGSVYYVGNPVVQRTGHGSGSVVPMGG